MHAFRLLWQHVPIQVFNLNRKWKENVHSLALKPREHLWCKPYVHDRKKWGKHRDMYALSINDAQFKLYLLDD